MLLVLLVLFALLVPTGPIGDIRPIGAIGPSALLMGRGGGKHTLGGCVFSLFRLFVTCFLIILPWF